MHYFSFNQFVEKYKKYIHFNQKFNIIAFVFHSENFQFNQDKHTAKLL